MGDITFFNLEKVQWFKNIENKNLNLARNAAKAIAMIPLLTDAHLQALTLSHTEC